MLIICSAEFYAGEYFARACRFLILLKANGSVMASDFGRQSENSGIQSCRLLYMVRNGIKKAPKDRGFSFAILKNLYHAVGTGFFVFFMGGLLTDIQINVTESHKNGASHKNGRIRADQNADKHGQGKIIDNASAQKIEAEAGNQRS